jgi:tetratricopeptide (TPR) repeat protein
MKKLAAFVMLLSLGVGRSAIVPSGGCKHSDPVLTEADRLTSQGRHSDARTLLEAALTDRERGLRGGNSYETLPCILDRLATNLARAGQLKEAVGLSLRAVETSRTVPPNQTTVILANNLAAFYVELSDLDNAERWAQQALSIARQTTDEDHPDRLLVYTTLAAIHGYRGDFARAEPLYRSALFRIEKNYGSRLVEVGLIAGNLADICRVQERHAEAIELYRKAIAVFESVSTTDDWQVLWARSGLMVSCAATGRYIEAESLSKWTLETADRLLPETDPRFSTVLHRLAEVKLSRHDLAGARLLLERALPILESAYGATSPRIVAPMQTYARALRAAKDGRTAKQVEARIRKLLTSSRQPHP